MIHRETLNHTTSFRKLIDSVINVSAEVDVQRLYLHLTRSPEGLIDPNSAHTHADTHTYTTYTHTRTHAQTVIFPLSLKLFVPPKCLKQRTHTRTNTQLLYTHLHTVCADVSQLFGDC